MIVIASESTGKQFKYQEKDSFLITSYSGVNQIVVIRIAILMQILILRPNSKWVSKSTFMFAASFQ